LGSAAPHRGHPWIAGLGAFGFGVVLLGAQVANFHAGMFCLGLPFCDGTLLPPDVPLARLQWFHRAAAYGFAFAALGLALWTRRRTDVAAQPLRRAANGVVHVT